MLDAIRRRDPAFDQTRFLSRAEAVLALVLRSRAEGRPEQTRAVVSDDMALRLRTELEGQRAAGRRQVHEGVRVRSAEIAEVASDERWDTVAVRFSLEGAAYEADAEGKAVPGANRDRRRWAEVWWFQRRAGTTTSAADDNPLDRCPGCGAPVTPTSDGQCAYCQHRLSSPSTWVLARVSDAAPGSHAAYSAVTFDATGIVEATAKAGRAVGVIVLVVVVLVIGGVAAGVVAAARATKEVATAFTDSTDPVLPGPSLPAGVNLPPGFTFPRPGPTAPTTIGFVTPVANPQVKAPVNDVTAAVAEVQAKVGRPLMASSLYVYSDGRISFALQATDDPQGVDNWVWKAGTVTGPEQGTIGVDPSKVFPVAGLDLTNLARLCDAAIGASGIADGLVENPYLLKVGAGLRWYIPVQSESRKSTRKTYRVAPDGTKPEVF